MSQRDRIDPQSRVPLEALLAQFPGGGPNAVADVALRRANNTALCIERSAALGPNDRVSRADHFAPGPAGAPAVRVRVYRPIASSGVLPGVFYIHGGGMILGTIEDSDLGAAGLSEAVNAVLVSVDYRLAPEHPHPAQVQDCYAALVWMAEHAEELGFDPTRLAVYGASAGGGLTVATSLMARDRGGPSICYQMPIYPMLDDRNESPSSHEITDVGVWDRTTNVQAWSWYLGGAQPDAYAAPARAADLSGLPPTFIDVGEMDLFRDEDIEFASRLLRAGVPTELHVYPGAYHGSDGLAPAAPLSQRIWATRIAALMRALDLSRTD